MKITKAQWEAKGRELFGGDMAAWVFVCPSCGNEMSVAKARQMFAAELPRLRAGGFSVEAECIGRHVPGVGCDWAAFGLLAGPLFVDGTPAFDFAGRPFTEAAGAREGAAL